MSSTFWDEATFLIRETWIAAPHDAPFFSKLRKVVRNYRRFCIRKAGHLQEQEAALCKLLDQKTGLLQLDPLSPHLQHEISHIKIQQASFENRKLEGRKVRSLARWRLFGDRLTTEFFQAVREVPQTSSITELLDHQGIVRQGIDALDQICSSFYTSFTCKTLPPLQLRTTT